MKLKLILEEMSANAFTVINKNIKRIVKQNNISGFFTVKNGIGGTYAIFKDGKKFATVPFSRINNDLFLKEVLVKGIV